MRIHSNGSKWYGQQPDTIGVLLDVLKREPLDPTFERAGGFSWRNGSRIHFHGNFAHVSHVFHIDGEAAEPEAIALEQAIAKNMRTRAYRALRPKKRVRAKKPEQATTA